MAEESATIAPIDDDDDASSVEGSPPPQFSDEFLQQKEVPCVCQGGETVNVRVSLLLQCKMFEIMWKELRSSTDGEEAPINFVFPISVVSAPVFKKVVGWMENHVGKPPPVIEEDPVTRERIWFTFTEFETEFFKVPAAELGELLMAGNFLELKSLYVYGCQAMAALITDKSPEEIRDILGLEDDLTEEEKAETRRANAWVNY